MDLKNILKTLKLNEGTISTILGVIVVLTVGFLVINYFKGLSKNPASSNITSTSTTNVNIAGGQHTVAQGETLWSIAEKYYNSGYDWKDIAQANNLTNPSEIEVGQTLNIPAKESDKVALVSASPSPTATPTMSASPIPSMTPAPTMAPAQPTSITAGTEYTIVKGDSLWKIAVRTYGDGYQWTKIWHANKQIKNPNLIFVGNKLTLPQ